MKQRRQVFIAPVSGKKKKIASHGNAGPTEYGHKKEGLKDL